MTNSKTTKGALLASTISLLLCFAMLLGTTFAWFTDSVTSAGNTIQAGTLDVDLVDADDNSMEGKVIAFVAKDGREQEEILWEPGCTYETQPVYVVNNGNLALKYEIAINGINGDAKLLEAIEWTVTVGGTTTALADLKGELLPEAKSGAIVLSGHMKEEAGNEYQDLTAGGISITVYAAQLTAEEDSFGKDYDEDADYYIHVNPENIQEAIHEAKNGDILYLDAGTYGDLVLENADGSPKSGITLAHDRPGQNSLSNPFSVGQINLNSSENITISGLYFDITKAQPVYSKSGATDYVASITGAKAGANTGAKNIVIDNCRFAGTSAAPANYAAICFEEQGRPTSRATNITVKNCYMDKAAFNFVRMNYMAAGTITIENNSIIETTGHNALNFTGNGADLIITGNYFGRSSAFSSVGGWNPEKSAIGTSRQGTRNIKIVITGNTFINTLGTEGVVLDLKSSYTADNTTLDFSGNTFLGGLAGLTEETVPSNKF